MADSRVSSGAGTYSYTIPNSEREYPDNSIYSSAFAREVGEVFGELEELLLRKHVDYGPKNISESPGGPINGLRVRIHDKVARINNLYDKNVDDPQYESFEDSFKDLANYAIIALLVLRGKWDS